MVVLLLLGVISMEWEMLFCAPSEWELPTQSGEGDGVQ